MCRRSLCVEGGCTDEWRCLDMSRTRSKYITATVVRIIIQVLVLPVHTDLLKWFVHTCCSESLSVNYCWIPAVLPEAFSPALWYQTGTVCPHYVHYMNQSGAPPMSLVEKSTSKYLEMITESSFFFLEVLNVCFGQ